MQTIQSDHQAVVSHTLNGARLTLQVDVSAGSFENLASDSAIFPIALSASDRSTWLVRACVAALEQAQHQFEQSLHQSWHERAHAELASAQSTAGGAAPCHTCNGRGLYRPPYSFEMLACPTCATAGTSANPVGNVGDVSQGGAA